MLCHLRVADGEIVLAASVDAARTVPLVVDALADLSPDMRRAAATALGKIAGGTVWPEERPWNAYTEEYRNELVFPKAMTVEKRVAEVLELQGRVRDTVVPPLAEALEDGDRTVRFAAARALGNIGAKAAPAAPALVGKRGAVTDRGHHDTGDDRANTADGNQPPTDLIGPGERLDSWSWKRRNSVGLRRSAKLG